MYQAELSRAEQFKLICDLYDAITGVPRTSGLSIDSDNQAPYFSPLITTIHGLPKI